VTTPNEDANMMLADEVEDEEMEEENESVG